ncbi:MAG: protein kinase [Leptolinea sp.]|nr:protein kinase [Leptolinea sp.]
MILETGTLLNNRYRIVSVLGQGGMGAVYRAVDERLGSPVALKENLNLAEEFARQFKREAITLASLRHPSLPRVADYFAFPKQGQYLVMDYIEGEDLRQRIERADHLPDREVVLIGEAVCDALTYLHTRIPPVIHRDIKPGNIKITPNQKVFLVDFGLVKLDYGNQATTTGARAMTPGYSPPEQYGTARTDARTDIYSLAATLYAALTGSIPEDSITRATRNVPLTPIPSMVPHCSKHLAVVIEKGLELNPVDRYQTASEFREALLNSLEMTSSFLSPPRVSAPPPDAVDNVVIEEDFEEELFTPEPIFAKPVEPQPVVEPILEPAYNSQYRNKSRVLLISSAIVSLLVLGSFFIPWRNLPSFIRNNPPPAVAIPSETVVAGQEPKEPTAAIAEVVVNPTPAQVAAATLDELEFTASPSTETSELVEETIAPETVEAVNTPEATEAIILPTSGTPLPAIGGSTHIAFASERTGNPQIWTMGSDGNNQKQITGMSGGACQPSWSPDGTKIAFISPCNGKREIYPGARIYITDSDGKNTDPLPIPLNRAGDFAPTWSPDGNMLAFVSLRADGRPHLFLFSFSDTSFQQITDAAYGDISPAWSSSGLQLAFVRQFPNPQIWITDLTGKQQFQYSPSGPVYNAFPEWGQDGSILFYSQTSPDPIVYYLVGLSYEDRGKSKEFRIPPLSADDIGPIIDITISPDGQWFLYESWPDGTNHDVFMMSIDGTDRRRMTADKDRDFHPAWKPSVNTPS